MGEIYFLFVSENDRNAGVESKRGEISVYQSDKGGLCENIVIHFVLVYHDSPYGGKPEPVNINLLTDVIHSGTSEPVYLSMPVTSTLI
jgi:hypothetical protein